MRGSSKMCEQTFAQAVDGHRAMLRGVTDIETSRSRALQYGQPEELVDTQSEAPSEQDGAGSSHGMRFGIFDSTPGASSGSEAKAPKSKKQRFSAAKALPGQPNASTTRTSSPARSVRNEQRQQQQPGQTLRVPEIAARGSKKAQELIKKAGDSLAKHKEAFTDSNIWTNRTRRRILEGAIKALSGLANQLLALNTEPAEELSREITEWSDRAEIRFDALAKVRSHALDYAEIEAVPAESLQPLRELGVAMLSNVILYVGAECLKQMEKDRGSVRWSL